MLPGGTYFTCEFPERNASLHRRSSKEKGVGRHKLQSLIVWLSCLTINCVYDLNCVIILMVFSVSNYNQPFVAACRDYSRWTALGQRTRREIQQQGCTLTTKSREHQHSTESCRDGNKLLAMWKLHSDWLKSTPKEGLNSYLFYTSLSFQVYLDWSSFFTYKDKMRSRSSTSLRAPHSPFR